MEKNNIGRSGIEPPKWYPVFGIDEYYELSESRREEEFYWKEYHKKEFSAWRAVRGKAQTKNFIDRYY
jgi:hypothetical protein